MITKKKKKKTEVDHVEIGKTEKKKLINTENEKDIRSWRLQKYM